ncbi:MAG: quinolinate synthase NadA [Chloroflexi bacterium]|nr:quinolinate synthase NadA [Chloroflexota bacterium]
MKTIAEDAVIKETTCPSQGLQETAPPVVQTPVGLWGQTIPVEYARLSPDELDARIASSEAKLGTRLLILGHHYQRDEIIRFADYRGDSFKLAQYAASRPEAEFIVFCGVHFMAESADILSASNQKVILPNMSAGCSMADMAPTEEVLDCWEDLRTVLPTGLLPITYMNSTAALKAFCGRYDGSVCTSSNAKAVLTWAFGKAERILFFPDQHLGRNTGLKLGLKLEDMAVWDPQLPMGGNSKEQLKRARLILWKGHCSVHLRFTAEQIKRARERYPGIKVIVHPECTMEVVQDADMDGSTEFISKTITQSPAGSKWAVGTEINLVNRLSKENPDKTIFCLDPIVCPCSTMYRIHPAYLAWALENLVAGVVVNQVSVDKEVAHWARVALDRMLSIT